MSGFDTTLRLDAGPCAAWGVAVSLSAVGAVDVLTLFTPVGTLRNVSLHAHVASWLEVWKAPDADRRQHLRRAGELLSRGAAAFDRQSFRPGHFTASAIVLSPDGRSVLLILHGKLGRWLQPGGHFEPGDRDPLAAACRECAEEVGLCELEPLRRGLWDLDVHPIPARPGEPAHEHFDLRVLLGAGSWSVRAGSDARDVRWVPLDRLAQVETDASVRRAVADLP